MTEEVKPELPPEPKFTHYERRNNVMLKVFDNGKSETHQVCGSINLAKKLSITLQKTGAKVRVDKEACNFHKPVRKHKVLTKSQSINKSVLAGPRMSAEDALSLARALGRSLVRDTKVAR
jgi:hypothetical protein